MSRNNIPTAFASSRRRQIRNSLSLFKRCILVILVMAFSQIPTFVNRPANAHRRIMRSIAAAPPSVTITSPANGATFTAPASITITATASDTDGTVTKVEFFRGATKLGEDVTAPYSFRWNNVPAGNYDLTAKATDNSGETTISSVVNIMVNPNTPPTVSLTSPSDGSTFNVPADVILAATAADSDGTISNVQFFDGTKSLGTDWTAPYGVKWHAPAGTHALTAKATDNGGAITVSSVVNIVVNAMTISPDALICPNSSSSTIYSLPFAALDQTINIPINLAPCQTVAVTWAKTNFPGTGLTLTYYNHAGQPLYSRFFNATVTTSGQFPDSPTQPFPWVGTVGLPGLPMYLIVESTLANPPAPREYQVTVTKESRPGYNLGGRSFDTALQVGAFPSTFYGSLRTQDQGQFFKFRLEGNQSLYLSGYAQGSTASAGFYQLDIFDSSQHFVGGYSWDPDDYAGLFLTVVANGIKEYSTAFTNPSSTAADFYIRLRAGSGGSPVYDFRLNLLLHGAVIAPLTAVPKNSIVPLQVTLVPPTNQRPTTLSLRTLSGTGEARFADDSTQMTITQTTTVQIKGVTESSVTDNIRLEAKDGDILLDTEDFTVTVEQCPWLAPDRTSAPDANVNGPYSITAADYQFPAANDPDILQGSDLFFDPDPTTGIDRDPRTGREVELWARVWRPTNLSAGPFPLVVFLHGNHGTCGRGANPRIDDNADYTITGTCPANYVVVPNHMGYKYLAERLATWGYIVVSINANRGITAAPRFPDAPADDPNYIDARGRLVLRHLQRLSEWNTNGGAPSQLGNLQGKINFSQVGLMGHSRGGEGMRSAYDLYRPANSPWRSRIPNTVDFRGIFEFAPTDRYANRSLQADGVAWNVLLPMCDGDLVELSGVKPFDRMMALTGESPATQKSTYTVWGANHNFFNTEWQQNESNGCIDHTQLPRQTTGSSSQRQIALASLVAFFRANVGSSATPSLNQNFNPRYNPPQVVTSVTRVDQGFTPSPSSTVTRVFDDFNPPGATNLTNHSDVTVTYPLVAIPRDDPSLRAAWVKWTSSGPDRYFQSNWTPVGSSNDVSGFQTLDFRVSRQIDAFGNPMNTTALTNFSIQLVMDDGTLEGSPSSAVPLCRYADLRGPVGGLGGVGGTAGRHPILQTVRIPLTDFANSDLSRLRGVRLVFNISAPGHIYVANMRFTR